MGSGPYWVHEGREAEVELEISPKVAEEEEAEEWLLSSLQNKHQNKGGTRRKGRHNQHVSRIASRGSPHDPTMWSRPCDPTARSLVAACPRNYF